MQSTPLKIPVQPMDLRASLSENVLSILNFGISKITSTTLVLAMIFYIFRAFSIETDFLGKIIRPMTRESAYLRSTTYAVLV